METVEIDDLNLMASLGIYDTSSGACERVESYLGDEYGAAFEYDEEEGGEIVRFDSNEGLDRFNADFYNGDLRSELREVANDY